MKAFAADPTSAFKEMKTKNFLPTNVYLANMSRLLKIFDPLISDSFIKMHLFYGSKRK